MNDSQDYDSDSDNPKLQFFEHPDKDEIEKYQLLRKESSKNKDETFEMLPNTSSLVSQFDSSVDYEKIIKKIEDDERKEELNRINKNMTNEVKKILQNPKIEILNGVKGNKTDMCEEDGKSLAEILFKDKEEVNDNENLKFKEFPPVEGSKLMKEEMPKEDPEKDVEVKKKKMREARAKPSKKKSVGKKTSWTFFILGMVGTVIICVILLSCTYILLKRRMPNYNEKFEKVFEEKKIIPDSSELESFKELKQVKETLEEYLMTNNINENDNIQLRDRLNRVIGDYNELYEKYLNEKSDGDKQLAELNACLSDLKKNEKKFEDEKKILGDTNDECEKKLESFFVEESISKECKERNQPNEDEISRLKKSLEREISDGEIRKKSIMTYKKDQGVLRKMRSFNNKFIAIVILGIQLYIVVRKFIDFYSSVKNEVGEKDKIIVRVLDFTVHIYVFIIVLFVAFFL